MKTQRELWLDRRKAMRVDREQWWIYWLNRYSNSQSLYNPAMKKRSEWNIENAHRGFYRRHRPVLPPAAHKRMLDVIIYKVFGC